MTQSASNHSSHRRNVRSRKRTRQGARRFNPRPGGKVSGTVCSVSSILVPTNFAINNKGRKLPAQLAFMCTKDGRSRRKNRARRISNVNSRLLRCLSPRQTLGTGPCGRRTCMSCVRKPADWAACHTLTKYRSAPPIAGVSVRSQTWGIDWTERFPQSRSSACTQGARFICSSIRKSLVAMIESNTLNVRGTPFLGPISGKPF